MSECYRTLVEGLRAASVSAYFQSPDQLVVSRQHGPVLPQNGNSFWVSRREDSWYLGTWTPILYRVPHGADLVSLCVEFVDYGRDVQRHCPGGDASGIMCVEFVDYGRNVQWRVPAPLLAKYRLVELTDEEAEEVFDL